MQLTNVNSYYILLLFTEASSSPMEGPCFMQCCGSVNISSGSVILIYASANQLRFRPYLDPSYLDIFVANEQ